MSVTFAVAAPEFLPSLGATVLVQVEDGPEVNFCNGNAGRVLAAANLYDDELCGSADGLDFVLAVACAKAGLSSPDDHARVDALLRVGREAVTRGLSVSWA